MQRGVATKYVIIVLILIIFAAFMQYFFFDFTGNVPQLPRGTIQRVPEADPCAEEPGGCGGGNTECTDGVDNDGDGGIDLNDRYSNNGQLLSLRDFNCENMQDNDEYSGPNPPQECNDGIDNDHDGYCDWGPRAEIYGCEPWWDANAQEWVYPEPEDVSCTFGQDNGETFPIPTCQDGIDNDLDGYIDYHPSAGTIGPGSANTPDSPSDSPLPQRVPVPVDNPNPPLNPPECDDGIDNDNDGAVDFQNDISCSDQNDDSERYPLQQCNDGIDNDNDGFCDTSGSPCLDDSIPGDVNCLDPQGDDESSLGFVPEPWYTNADGEVVNDCATNQEEEDTPSPGGTACSNQIDDDGDGFCDFFPFGVENGCLDGSTPGDYGCNSWLEDDSAARTAGDGEDGPGSTSILPSSRCIPIQWDGELNQDDVMVVFVFDNYQNEPLEWFNMRDDLWWNLLGGYADEENPLLGEYYPGFLGHIWIPYIYGTPSYYPFVHKVFNPYPEMIDVFYVTPSVNDPRICPLGANDVPECCSQNPDGSHTCVNALSAALDIANENCGNNPKSVVALINGLEYLFEGELGDATTGYYDFLFSQDRHTVTLRPNPSAPRSPSIVSHELGHGIFDLADEYELPPNYMPTHLNTPEDNRNLAYDFFGDLTCANPPLQGGWPMKPGWDDLVGRFDFPDVGCLPFRPSPSFGGIHRSFGSIMGDGPLTPERNYLLLPFGSVNERIACCFYGNLYTTQQMNRPDSDWNLPPFCDRYIDPDGPNLQVARTISQYCDWPLGAVGCDADGNCP